MFLENQIWSLSVYDILRLTPWVFWSEIFIGHSSLCLLSFGWDLNPNLSNKIWNKFCIQHCQHLKEVSFVCETVWLFFMGEYSSVSPEIFRVLSPIQSRFFREICRKNYFGRIFHKFYWKPRVSSTETCEISPYFRQFYSGFVLRWEKFTQVLSYVVCTQVRRHVHKQITKRR